MLESLEPWTWVGAVPKAKLQSRKLTGLGEGDPRGQEGGEVSGHRAGPTQTPLSGSQFPSPYERLQPPTRRANGGCLG